MSHHWQRWSDITDSSAEQSLVVGCFAFFRQVRPLGYLGGQRRTAKCSAASAAGRLASHALGRDRTATRGAWRRSCRLRLEPDRSPPLALRHLVCAAVLHGSSPASADGSLRLVTWGSASADRSITDSMERPGFRSTNLLGGWHARSVPASVGNDCGARFRLLSTVVCAGNDKKATGRSDAVLAADEGNSSKGVNRVAGKAPRASTVLRDACGSLETRNAANPGPVAGCNRPANQRAEKTVEVGAKPRGRNQHDAWQCQCRRELAPGS
jgi:hypothetical protein